MVPVGAETTTPFENQRRGARSDRGHEVMQAALQRLRCGTGLVTSSWLPLLTPVSGTSVNHSYQSGVGNHYISTINH